MNKNNNVWVLLAIFLACLTALIGQTYAPPTNLSPKDVAEWSIAGGFIANGNAVPTTTTGIATGSLYIDTTATASPKLWRFNGASWAQLSGADSDTVLAHLAAIQDPHGAIMGVSEQVTIGDPAGVHYGDIDFPQPGLARIASNAQLLEMPQYESNVSASAGGLASGTLYRNASGVVLIVY